MAQGTLSASEAAQLRPKLVEAILQAGDSADEVLTNTNRQKVQANIWSSLDEDDAATLTDALLGAARKSGIAAAGVRAVAQGYLSVRVLIILGPRAWQTLQWYPQHGGFTLQ